jgi:hypothetical protein|tara:strand:- start:1257 stop:1508 length:252 start_codon:yes stop_codon:yes gene_type:complete
VAADGISSDFPDGLPGFFFDFWGGGGIRDDSLPLRALARRGAGLVGGGVMGGESYERCLASSGSSKIARLIGKYCAVVKGELD